MGVTGSGGNIHNNTVDNEDQPTAADRSLSNNRVEISQDKPRFNKGTLKTSQGNRRRPPMAQDTFGLKGMS